jgi:hypothetical protein
MKIKFLYKCPECGNKNSSEKWNNVVFKLSHQLKLFLKMNMGVEMLKQNLNVL